jgi:hypothetical protein
VGYTIETTGAGDVALLGPPAPQPMTRQAPMAAAVRHVGKQSVHLCVAAR